MSYLFKPCKKYNYFKLYKLHNIHNAYWKFDHNRTWMRNNIRAIHPSYNQQPIQVEIGEKLQ